MLAKRVIDHLTRGTLLEAILENLNINKNMQKNQQQIELASQWPNSSATRNIVRILKHIFNKKPEKYIGLPINYLNHLAQLLYVRNALQKISVSNTLDLIAYTEELKPEMMSPIRWNDLSYLLLSNGFLRISEVTHTKAVKSAYLQVDGNNKSISCLTTGLKAALDQGDLFLAEKYLFWARDLNLEASLLESFLFFYYVLKGQVESKIFLAKKNYSGNDCIYADYIYGKSVAIVGPAPTEDNSAEEIDSHDIVIRLNYRGSKSLPENSEIGRKTDVSYYNGDNSLFIDGLRDKAFLNDLIFSIYKSSKYMFQKESINNSRGRLLFGLDNIYFSGLPNMIQCVLNDLMHFQPSHVKLFNVNFFMSEKAYHRNYTSFGINKNDNKKNWQIFAIHNPVSQKNYTKNLWLAGNIVADHHCEKILLMNNGEYMSKLEEIYGG